MQYVLKLSRQMGIPFKRFINEIDNEELDLYLAYERIDPMPDPWMINAINCQVTGASAGQKCKVDDFIPSRKVYATAEQASNALKGLFCNG